MKKVSLLKTLAVGYIFSDVKTISPASIATQIELPMEQIAEFCRRWKIAKLEIFGSILRDDFRSESDIDFLYTPAPGSL